MSPERSEISCLVCLICTDSWLTCSLAASASWNACSTSFGVTFGLACAPPMRLMVTTDTQTAARAARLTVRIREKRTHYSYIPRRLPGELTGSRQGRPTAQVRADSPHTHCSPAHRDCLPHTRNISAVRPMSARSAAHTPDAQAPTLGVDEGSINFRRHACRDP